MNSRWAMGLMLGAMLIVGGCESNPETNSYIDPGEPHVQGDKQAFSPVTITNGTSDAPWEGVPGSIGADNAKLEQPVRLAVEPDATAAKGVRILTYSGSISMVVTDVASTLDSIRKTAEEMGGYLQESEERSITVRVPAAKFDALVAAVQGKGEVVDKQIKSEDVTETMRDLDIRLVNAQQTRERLLALLEKSAKMEDTLKIEAELERVTEEVELLKGKIHYLQVQVAYSVLRVDLNSRVPQKQLAAVIPFPWVRELGQGAVSGEAPKHAVKSGWFSGGVGFDLPAGYIRYYQEDDLTEAMSAEGVLIKAQRHDNFKGGDEKFWTSLARRALVNGGSLAISREEDGNGLIEGSRDGAGGNAGVYADGDGCAGMMCIHSRLGEKTLIDKDHDALKKAGETMAK